MYAHKDELQARGKFPRSWRNQETGDTWLGAAIEKITTVEQETLGWYVIVDNLPVLQENQRAEPDSLVFKGTTIEQNYTVVTDLSIEQLKQSLIESLKEEGLQRLQTHIPALDNWNMVDLVEEIWKSISPAARQPTGALQGVIDVKVAGRSAALVINTLNLESELLAYDVVTDPKWPV